MAIHKLLANEFADTNKLPPEKGLLLFGLSMNGLEAKRLTEYDRVDLETYAVR